MTHWLIRTGFLLTFFIGISSDAWPKFPVMDRLNNAMNARVDGASGPVDFKNAIKVISGSGFVRSKDGVVITKATEPETPPLFWATQTTLVEHLKQSAATSKEVAIKELRDALFAHYLDDKTPLIAFVRDLEVEGQWLSLHASEDDNARLLEVWQSLVITVNNLLLW